MRFNKRQATFSILTVVAILMVAAILAWLLIDVDPSKSTIATHATSLKTPETKDKESNDVKSVLSNKLKKEKEQPAPTPEYIALDDCEEYYSNGYTPRSLKQDEIEYLRSIILRWESEGAPNDIVEMIFDAAGFSNDEIRGFQTGLGVLERPDWMPVNVPFIPMGFPDDLELNEKQKSLMLNMDFRSNLDEFVQSVQEGKINTNQNFIGGSLLAEVIERRRGVSLEELKRLVDLGLEIHFDVLVSSLYTDVDIKVMEYLIENYDGDLYRTWGYGTPQNRDANLALGAAEKLRPDLLELFASYGLETSLDLSVLDMMPIPKNESERKRALAIAEYALEHNMSPLLHSSQLNLESWLPEQVREKFGHQLTATIEMPSELDPLVEHIKGIKSFYEKGVEELALTESSCNFHHEYDAEKFVHEKVVGGDYDRDLSLEQKKMVEKYILEQSKAQTDLAKEMFKDNIESEEIDKDSYFGALSEDEVLAFSKKYEAVRDSFLKRQWRPAMDGALELYLETGEVSVYQSLFDFAVFVKLPPNFAKVFIENGASFSDSHAASLAKHASLEEFKILESLGLNIHAVNMFNQSLIHVLVESGSNVDLLEYLLAKGVRDPIEIQTPDALNVALERLSKLSLDQFNRGDQRSLATVKTVALLLKYKVRQDRSHGEQIGKLIEWYPQVLDLVTNAYPDFRPTFKMEDEY